MRRPATTPSLSEALAGITHPQLPVNLVASSTHDKGAGVSCQSLRAHIRVALAYAGVIDAESVERLVIAVRELDRVEELWIEWVTTIGADDAEIAEAFLGLLYVLRDSDAFIGSRASTVRRDDHGIAA